MSDAIMRAGQNAWLWRAILFKGVNGWLITVAGAVMAAHLMTPYQESILGCLIAGNKFLEGFINQDLAQIKREIAAALDTGFFRNTQQPQTTPEIKT